MQMEWCKRTRLLVCRWSGVKEQGNLYVDGVVKEQGYLYADGVV